MVSLDSPAPVMARTADWKAPRVNGPIRSRVRRSPARPVPAATADRPSPRSRTDARRPAPSRLRRRKTNPTHSRPGNTTPRKTGKANPPGPRRGQLADHGKEGDTDRPLLRLAAYRVRQQQRDLKRPPLRRWQLGKRLVE